MALLQEIEVPLLAVNDTTLTVVELSRPNGSRVAKGDLLMVFETSKTTYDVEATADGYVQYLCEVDRDYEVNTVVAKVFSDGSEAAAPASKPTAPAATAPATLAPATLAPAALAPAAMTTTHASAPSSVIYDWQGTTLFSREAEKLLAETGLDRSLFSGYDFVTAADIRQRRQPAAPQTKTSVPVQKTTLPVDTTKVIVDRLSSGKKKEIEYLGDIQSSGLTSTLHIYVATDGIFTHINRSLKYLKDSLLPVIVYEVSRLLKEFPLLNAYYTGDAIARYMEVNPGFAIDIDNKGLKVLKIANAGQKAIGDIENEIMRLSGAYLDDNLPLEDLTDITFTITDLSSEGVSFFKPLINKMNSAILGISAIDEKLQRFALSLTFDHRVTEGKAVAGFLNELRQRLESYRAVDTASKLKEVSCFKCYKTLGEDLGAVGFARVVTPEGKDGYICQSCLKGF